MLYRYLYTVVSFNHHINTEKYRGHPDDLDEISNQKHTPAARCLGTLVSLRYFWAEGSGTRLSFCHYFSRNIIHTEYISTVCEIYNILLFSYASGRKTKFDDNTVRLRVRRRQVYNFSISYVRRNSKPIA